MSKNIDEKIAEEQQAYKKKMEALKKEQRKQDARIEREVIKWMKKEQPQQWEQLRAAAQERLDDSKRKRAASKAAPAQQNTAPSHEEPVGYRGSSDDQKEQGDSQF